jgi:hypothetical protein
MIATAKYFTLDGIELDGVHWFQEVRIPIFLTLIQLPEEHDALIFFLPSCCGWKLSFAHSSNSPQAVHVQVQNMFAKATEKIAGL